MKILRFLKDFYSDLCDFFKELFANLEDICSIYGNVDADDPYDRDDAYTRKPRMEKDCDSTNLDSGA